MKKNTGEFIYSLFAQRNRIFVRKKITEYSLVFSYGESHEIDTNLKLRSEIKAIISLAFLLFEEI